MNFLYVTEHDQALASLRRAGGDWPETAGVKIEPVIFLTAEGFYALAFTQSGFYREVEEEETRDCGLIILAQPGLSAEAAEKHLMDHLAEISDSNGGDDSAE